MKLFISGLVLAVAAIGSAQVVFTEDFDSLNLGPILGQNNWLVSNGIVAEVEQGGGSNPAAQSGSQLLSIGAGQTQGGFVFRLASFWNNRDSGNDTLVFSTKVFAPSGNSGFVSAVLRVTGFQGSTLEDMGSIGIGSAGQLFATAGTTLVSGPNVGLNQWVDLRLEIDTVNGTSRSYGNGQFLAEQVFNPNIPLNSIAFGGTGSYAGEVYFDSAEVSAVPEPGCLALGGLICAGVMRRRKRSAV